MESNGMGKGRVTLFEEEQTSIQDRFAESTQTQHQQSFLVMNLALVSDSSYNLLFFILNRRTESAKNEKLLLKSFVHWALLMRRWSQSRSNDFSHLHTLIFIKSLLSSILCCRIIKTFIHAFVLAWSPTCSVLLVPPTFHLIALLKGRVKDEDRRQWKAGQNYNHFICQVHTRSATAE